MILITALGMITAVIMFPNLAAYAIQGAGEAVDAGTSRCSSIPPVPDCARANRSWGLMRGGFHIVR
jgi:hypothetical protein